MKATIGLVALFLAMCFMGLAFAVGIGYGLYLLGSIGLAFGPAAWGGFVVWAKMFGTGFLLYLVGLFVAATSK